MARTNLVLHDNLTPTQVEILRSDAEHMVISGPAGTGKTWITLVKGFRLLNAREIDRIIIIRSAVATRKLGYLPGDEFEKTEVFFAPYAPLIAQISPNLNYRELISRKKLCLESTSFLRGLTFDDAYVILDEYQNTSGHELETAVTRVGQGTRLALVGDSDQSDLVGAEAEEHREVIMTLSSMDSVACFEFGIDEIVRSAFVREYFEAKRAALKPPVRLWGT